MISTHDDKTVCMGGRLVDITSTNMPVDQTLPIFASAINDLAQRTLGLPLHCIAFVPTTRGGTTFRAISAIGTGVPGSDMTWPEMVALHASRAHPSEL